MQTRAGDYLGDQLFAAAVKQAVDGRVHAIGALSKRAVGEQA